MTLAMSILFVGFAVFNLSATARAQQDDHEQYITTTLHFIRAELEGRMEEGESEQTELAEIEDVVLRENASRSFGRLIVEITDEDGSVLLVTNSARKLMSRQPPFPPLAPSPGTATIAYWESEDGSHYVLSGFRTTGEKERRVKIALDWTEARHKVETFRRLSFGAAFACTILAAIAAALVTRHALRPLTVIRDAAEKIREGSFDARLEPDRLPAELGDLAHSFARMQEHLQESFERLSQFSAELAHELRTPVNNLMGETEVTLSKPRTIGEYEDALASNLEEMARLSRMIDSLLFLAHASRGSTRFETEPLDLAAEVDSVIEYHRAHAEESGITLSSSGSGTLSADRTLLRRALSNLLSNAIDASSAGGTVNVSIRQTSGPASITVTDDGTGIAEEDLPRVFERFHRSQDARARRPEGSGLGLAIVRSIVDLHGGSVSIRSRPGEGTTVTLLLPQTG
jgi:two-component system heavy metal sensor histidine kinase CusS